MGAEMRGASEHLSASPGTIVDCPNWYHAEMCKAPGCQDARAVAHTDCEWCGGSKKVRIVSGDDDHGYEVEAVA